MGNKSKAANHKGYRINKRRHTDIKKWEKLLHNNNQKSDSFQYQIERNLRGE